MFAQNNFSNSSLFLSFPDSVLLAHAAVACWGYRLWWALIILFLSSPSHVSLSIHPIFYRSNLSGEKKHTQERNFGVAWAGEDENEAAISNSFFMLSSAEVSFFCPQEQYNRLHKWMNHKWDFIVMQAKEQYRLVV